eukprot:TRINITY_DN574_c0_g12_i1.p1 TRINITY_DN574_c0_g12~~TRINITY_DN574_c0_g12_i1.p1  ORF type:complete len:405 (+),score=82.48 TRINITY_DN574_c0_g12_i1:176-1390(+)
MSIPYIYLAPMVDVTNRHFRFIVRSISKSIILYSEMLVDKSICYNPTHRDLISFPGEIEDEKTVIQLGGYDSDHLIKAIEICNKNGFKYFNLNCGCPSNKVTMNKNIKKKKKKRKKNIDYEGMAFGVSLMKKPDQVRDICSDILKSDVVKEIENEINNNHDDHHSNEGSRLSTLSIKCRIGIDEDNCDFLKEFISKVSSIGIDDFIIHARCAILSRNLSPKHNREIPELNYPLVYDIVKEFPELKFTLNGGISTFEKLKEHINLSSQTNINGFMIGRGIQKNPFEFLHQLDDYLKSNFQLPKGYFCNSSELDVVKNRRELIERYTEYGKEQQLINNATVQELLLPLVNVFSGCRNSSQIRSFLTNKSLRDSCIDNDVDNFENIMNKLIQRIPESVLEESKSDCK